MAGTIERFEDIEAWQDARILLKGVYEATAQGPFARDFGLRDQIRRAAISVMSNIAEGFERGSNKDFIRFLYMAKGSAGEVRSQLYAATDLGYLQKEKADEINALVQVVSRRISGFIKYLKSSAFDEKTSGRKSPRRSEAQH
ncbi:MAG: four helix bundle protein [Phycisphaerae bacterium]